MAAVGGWLILRAWIAGLGSAYALWLASVAGLVLCVVLGGLGWRALETVRRRQEVLEVYVGKRSLELVYSRSGAVLRRDTLELVRLEDAEPRRGGVVLHLDDGAIRWLPMGMHSEEAVGWMVEHLRGAGLGARRRFGHLVDP